MGCCVGQKELCFGLLIAIHATIPTSREKEIQCWKMHSNSLKIYISISSKCKNTHCRTTTIIITSDKEVMFWFGLFVLLSAGL